MFEVFAAVVEWNPLAVQNTHSMGLAEEVKVLFTNTDMLEKPPALVMHYPKRDYQIRHHRV